MTEFNDNTNINPLLIESFLRDGRKAVDIIKGLIGKDDFSDTKSLEQFRITVHGVKSSLRNIGEPGLADVAGELEDAGRNGDIEIINSGSPAFLDGLQALIEKIQPLQETNNIGEDPPDIKELLSDLKEMCSDYNRRGALKIIADITTCTSETRAILEAVKELVQNSDFEEAEALL